jgi:glycosyltransferase involved in cell wall biosynthesis
MSKKVLLILDEKSLVTNSWGWKYIFNFVPSLKENYELEIIYKPESRNFFTWLYRRLFELPNLLKRKYKWYVKIFYAEHYLNSVRSSFIDEAIVIIHHYPYLLKAKTIMDFIVKIMSYITFNTILKKIKHIIVVSKETENVLTWLWVNKEYITYIPNCIDLSSYKEIDWKEKTQIRDELSRKFKIPDNKKRLLYVWTNEARKNLTTLFNVLWKLDDNYILLRVWKDLYPDEKAKNDTIINKYNLSNRYYHLQNLSEEELISIYQVSDIYVMTSLYEWFGRPIIEAQACWLPVISTKCWALEEVCWDWALLVDDPFNTDEYIEKIDEIESKRDYLIKNGKKNAEKYSIDMNSKELLDLIK